MTIILGRLSDYFETRHPASACQHKQTAFDFSPIKISQNKKKRSGTNLWEDQWTPNVKFCVETEAHWLSSKYLTMPRWEIDKSFNTRNILLSLNEYLGMETFYR